MGAQLGMQIDLRLVPTADLDRDDKILFSESAGRFIVSIDPAVKDRFEAILSKHLFACIGKITESPQLEINGLSGECILSIAVSDLKNAWKQPFGALA